MLADLSNLDIEELVQKLVPFLIQYAIDFLVALVILLAGLAAAKWISAASMRLIGRIRGVDKTLAPLIASVIRYGIIIVVLIAVLAQLGVETTSVIALLGAAGLAIGLALQGTLANIAAGIMLLALRPFRVGEYIDAEGIAGTVDLLGLFTTELRTADGVFVSVPNSQLWNRTIINYNRNPTRRLDLPVRIAYGEDVDRAREILLGIAAADVRVLSEPAAIVFVDSLGEKAVNLVLRVWTATVDYWGVNWDLTAQVKLAMDESGITIPFTQREILYNVNRPPDPGPP